MKLLLVVPYNITDNIQPPLGLGYLATACRANQHNVSIIDCLKDGIKIDDLMKKINNLKPDVIGFQCHTFDLRFVKEILKDCKNLRADIITVLGGAHPSAAPEQSFAYFKDFLDFIFVGEAEKGLPMLLDKLENKISIDFTEIPGLAWRDDNNVYINPKIYIEDLDSLGMPAWDLLSPEKYPETPHGAFFNKFPVVPIIFTRGCPYLCAFCAAHLVVGRKIRKHSIDFMLKEIIYLYNTHKIREFHIVDDNFAFDKNYAKEFLKSLIALNLDISLATPNGVRIDTLDEELLYLMKKSGLYLISLGIESGSDRILKNEKKNITVKEIREAVSLIHSAKIDVAGFFIIGFPDETKEEIMKTINFSLKLGLLRANYFTYLPFPGTSSYNELASKGELEGVEWDRFDFMTAAYVPKGMTRRELRYLQRLAFFKFFIRPKIVWGNLRGIKSFNHFGFLIRRFFHWIIC